MDADGVPIQGGERTAETAPDDSEEWFGLEYTLELSNRERRASESLAPLDPSESVGEHSKVRRIYWAGPVGIF